MGRDDIQTLKGFASVILSAGRVSLQADEGWIDHYQIAGRPSGSGRIERSNSGGYKDEEIKIRPAVESCWHLGDKPMRFIAFYIDKLYGIDNRNKINSMLCPEGVA